jgi:hypothetical protein
MIGALKNATFLQLPLPIERPVYVQGNGPALPSEPNSGITELAAAHIWGMSD